jgi:membrane protein implicated in regulation of membrane protease activity
MLAKRIPGPLNDCLILIGGVLAVYASLRWYGGGGITWKILLGACLYFVASGLYQKFVRKKETPEK